MSEINILTDELLENVTGGRSRTVNTYTNQNAVLREGPGMRFGSITSLGNGTKVNTTGEVVFKFEDGRTWYEINYPVDGWIAGGVIGLDR